MEKFAIIDLGSNSVRLVLYGQDDTGTVQELDNIKSVLRLSAHINEKKEVDNEGIMKTIACLRRYKQLCDVKGITKVLGVATAAIRHASNREEVIRYIHEQTGILFRVLTGEEEAYYGYLAIVNSMDLREAVTVDIGGGSTEVTYFKDRKLESTHSFPFGAVTLTQRFLKSDPPTQEELSRLSMFLTVELSTQPWLKNLKCPVVIMGGTARNLARMDQRKNQYSLSSLHNYPMDKQELEEMLRALSSFSLEQRKQVDGLSKDRADIVISGLCVFKQVMDGTQSDQLITSNKGLRDGILYELLHGQENLIIPDVLDFSTHQFMKRYRVNIPHAFHVSHLATQIFDQLRQLKLHPFGERDRTLLKAAACLFDIGRSINIIESTKHTFYLIQNVLLMGVSHNERLTIGLIASYKNNKQVRKLAEQHTDLVDKENIHKAQVLGSVLLLARAMDRMMTNQVSEIKMSIGKNKIFVELHDPIMEDEWMYSIVADQIKKFTKTFGITFELKDKTQDKRTGL
ncbi:Ppx/GppA phosphatase family protein [Ammoniphilus sp. CFH 90114]|uniref:Ppx/GppA phosphatase family protein n=1 Tax=Ammoniphilus sp. CFH 90114 TaxID=2493665 RepID=UPI00100FAB98|nr:Ppx/GppA phosphatase family protein [Ammoniphilus sp. CFH 90114]RXT13867.1 Ppx/GppA family phosphatase [Ammoniphilus sp. CFH 90114]